MTVGSSTSRVARLVSADWAEIRVRRGRSRIAADQRPKVPGAAVGGNRGITGGSSGAIAPRPESTSSETASAAEKAGESSILLPDDGCPRIGLVAKSAGSQERGPQNVECPRTPRTPKCWVSPNSPPFSCPPILHRVRDIKRLTTPTANVKDREEE